MSIRFINNGGGGSITFTGTGAGGMSTPPSAGALVVPGGSVTIEGASPTVVTWSSFTRADSSSAPTGWTKIGSWFGIDYPPVYAPSSGPGSAGSPVQVGSNDVHAACTVTPIGSNLGLNLCFGSYTGGIASYMSDAAAGSLDVPGASFGGANASTSAAEVLTPDTGLAGWQSVGQMGNSDPFVSVWVYDPNATGVPSRLAHFIIFISGDGDPYTWNPGGGGGPV